MIAEGLEEAVAGERFLPESMLMNQMMRLMRKMRYVLKMWKMQPDAFQNSPQVVADR